MEKTRIVIFGANADGSNLYNQLKPLIFSNMVEVIAFADNDSRLHGSFLEGVEIIKPNFLPNYEFDKIIIAPIFFKVIRDQLSDIGIPISKIEILNNVEYFSTEDRVIGTGKVGRYSYFKPSTKIYSSDIGAFCHIGDNCIIGQSGHDVNRVTTYPLGYHYYDTTNDPSLDESASQEQMETRTTIKNDVYIGEGVVIFAGVTIGNGAVIGTKSIVTRDVPDYSIVAGIPAKVIRYRFAPDIIEDLLRIQWWNWNEKEFLIAKELFDVDASEFVRKLKLI